MALRSDDERWANSPTFEGLNMISHTPPISSIVYGVYPYPNVTINKITLTEVPNKTLLLL